MNTGVKALQSVANNKETNQMGTRILTDGSEEQTVQWLGESWRVVKEGEVTQSERTNPEAFLNNIKPREGREEVSTL